MANLGDEHAQMLAYNKPEGVVATRGWTESSGQLAVDIARKISDWPVAAILYTDVAKDGMLQGPNFGELELLLSSISCRLIASGGVSRTDDVRRLARMPGLYGCIIGKALYDGTLRLVDVVASRLSAS